MGDNHTDGVGDIRTEWETAILPPLSAGQERPRWHSGSSPGSRKAAATLQGVQAAAEGVQQGSNPLQAPPPLQLCHQLLLPPPPPLLPLVGSGTPRERRQRWGSTLPHSREALAAQFIRWGLRPACCSGGGQPASQPTSQPGSGHSVVALGWLLGCLGCYACVVATWGQCRGASP